jgi:hypothetical protein
MFHKSLENFHINHETTAHFYEIVYLSHRNFVLNIEHLHAAKGSLDNKNEILEDEKRLILFKKGR